MKNRLMLLILLTLLLVACQKQTAIPDQPVNGHYSLDLSSLSEQERNKFSDTLRSQGIPEWSVRDEKVLVYVQLQSDVLQESGVTILEKYGDTELRTLPGGLILKIPTRVANKNLVYIAKKKEVRRITEEGEP